MLQRVDAVKFKRCVILAFHPPLREVQSPNDMSFSVTMVSINEKIAANALQMTAEELKTLKTTLSEIHREYIVALISQHMAPSIIKVRRIKLIQEAVDAELFDAKVLQLWHQESCDAHDALLWLLTQCQYHHD